MNLEHQKIELINWITTINNQEIIDKLEAIKAKSNNIPAEIMELLLLSEKDTETTPHTSAKDLIK